MQELLTRRTENSKTYNLGGHKRHLVSSIGAIHYKDNYDDPIGEWKDIDLTYEESTIYAPKLVIEYTETGWSGEFCGVAVAEFNGVIPAEIDGV